MLLWLPKKQVTHATRLPKMNTTMKKRNPRTTYNRPVSQHATRIELNNHSYDRTTEAHKKHRHKPIRKATRINAKSTIIVR